MFWVACSKPLLPSAQKHNLFHLQPETSGRSYLPSSCPPTHTHTSYPFQSASRRFPFSLSPQLSQICAVRTIRDEEWGDHRLCIFHRTTPARKHHNCHFKPKTSICRCRDTEHFQVWFPGCCELHKATRHSRGWLGREEVMFCKGPLAKPVPH